MASNYSSILDIDEQRWIEQIHRILEEESESEDEDIQPSIFEVPITLKSINPDSYTPRLILLGPYHRKGPVRFEMERNKLLLTKKTHRHLLQGENFQILVDQFKLLGSKIRGSYQKGVRFGKETILQMMAVDGAFLLHFLKVYNENKFVVDNAIIRDVVMLENQIPLLVLRKIIEIEGIEENCALDRMLVSLCKDLSPFEIEESFENRFSTVECAHVLDFLYRVVAPRIEHNVQEGEDEVVEVIEEDTKCGLKESHSRGFLRFKKAVGYLFHKLLLSRPMKIVFALPLIAFCQLPALAILKDPVQNLFLENVDRERELKLESPRITSSRCNALPVDEIAIPSVSELLKSGITFVPTKGGIKFINFDTDTGEFHLPVIRFDENSKVVLRNLVAYEATSSSGPLAVARYTELMNGIIDSEEDARFLREQGIILNRMKSDEEVARMWNGMSKSLRQTKAVFLDRVIEDVNRYYDASWRVKLGKATEVCLSKQFLTIVAVVVFLFLMSMQVFLNSNRRRSGDTRV